MRPTWLVLALCLAAGLGAEGVAPGADLAAQSEPALALFFAPLGQSRGVEGAAAGVELALARRLSARGRAQTMAVYAQGYPGSVVEEWVGGTVDLRWYYIRPGPMRGAFFALSGEVYHAEFLDSRRGRVAATLSGLGAQTGWQFVLKERWLLCPAYNLRWLTRDGADLGTSSSNASLYGQSGRVSGNWELAMGVLF